jgi:hypothetical protein
MTPLDQAEKWLAEGMTPSDIRARLQKLPPAVLRMVIDRLPQLATTQTAEPGTPYARALDLQQHGCTDQEILEALCQAGLSADDAQFVLKSLPGREFGDTRVVRQSDHSELAVDGAIEVIEQLTDQPIGQLYKAFRILNE